MCETAADVQELDGLLDAVEAECQIPNHSVKVQCSIETARGGAERPGDCGCQFPGHLSLLWCRGITHALWEPAASNRPRSCSSPGTYLPVVAAEAGISAIDTGSALDDQEGLRVEVRNARALGFSGKSCIHPSQIPVVPRQALHPWMEEVAHARQVMEAMRAAEQAHIGVFNVDGKMVDSPVIAKAPPGPAQIGGCNRHGICTHRIKRRIPTEVEGIGKLRPLLEPGKAQQVHHRPGALCRQADAQPGPPLNRWGRSDGMTISFHHHLRNGDLVLPQVMADRVRASGT